MEQVLRFEELVKQQEQDKQAAGKPLHEGTKIAVLLGSLPVALRKV